MNSEGAIIGKAGDYSDERSLGAIVSNVWADYLEIGKEVLKQKEMPYIFINTVSSRIFAKRIGNMILLLRSNKDAELGILKAKADILNGIIGEQISKLEINNEKKEIEIKS